MTYRMLLSSCALLLCLGSSFAQAPPAPVPNSAMPDTLGPLPALEGGLAPAASPTVFWVSGDYAFSLFKGANLPPLVTTSPAGTPFGSAGVPGTPGASTVFGGNSADESIRPGFRLGAGFWFTPDHMFGMEAGFMMTGSQADIFGASSNGNPILARPYSDAITGLNQAIVVAYPGSSTGNIAIREESNNFYTGNIDFVGKTLDVGWFRLDTMFGYRYYNYNESLGIQQNIAPTANFAPGTVITSTDSFRVQNDFNGFDMAIRGEFFFLNSLSLETIARVAVGDVHSVVNINGTQAATSPGAAAVVTPGGVLALPSNIGSYSYTHLTSMPEFDATFKWQVTSYLQLRAGYSFMYLDGIMRAGNQVDTAINTANLAPGATPAPPFRPAFGLTRTDMWIQTFNVGMALSY